MRVKFKKLHEDAVRPTRADLGSAGYDLTAVTKEKAYHPQDGYLQYVEYSTEIAMELPDGYVGLLFPRSSISKQNLSLSNAVGVLDSSFRGAIKLRFKNLGPAGRGEYEIGERVAQLVLVRYEEMDFVESEELSKTNRGDGGFGSSGK